jgi:hypothetical protein
LRQLQVPDAGSNYLSETIMAGNDFLAGRLEGVIAAINRQTETQQAELKRQQDLTRAQKKLEEFFTFQTPQIQAAESALASKVAQKQEFDHHINTVRPDYNGWSYGVRWNYDYVWMPGSQRLGGEIAADQAKLNTDRQAYQAELERQRQAIRSLGGIPAFAAGGMHTGGLRLVGENGPELEVTGPARYYSAAETSSMMGGGMVDELRGLREEVAMLRAEARATAINTGRTQDIMKRITKNGESMIVSTDGEALEVTAP